MESELMVWKWYARKKVYFAILFAGVKHEAIVNIERCSSCVWCRVSWLASTLSTLKLVLSRWLCELKARVDEAFRLFCRSFNETNSSGRDSNSKRSTEQTLKIPKSNSPATLHPLELVARIVIQTSLTSQQRSFPSSNSSFEIWINVLSYSQAESSWQPTSNTLNKLIAKVQQTAEHFDPKIIIDNEF